MNWQISKIWFNNSKPRSQPYPRSQSNPRHRVSNQTDPLPSMVRSQNPSKHVSFRCSNYAPSPLSHWNIAYSSLPLFLRIRLLCGGDPTTNPSTSRPMPPTGMDSSPPCDNSLSQSTPASAHMTDSNASPRKPQSMHTTMSSEPLCWNSLTWTRPHE